MCTEYSSGFQNVCHIREIQKSSEITASAAFIQRSQRNIHEMEAGHRFRTIYVEFLFILSFLKSIANFSKRLQGEALRLRLLCPEQRQMNFRWIFHENSG